MVFNWINAIAMGVTAWAAIQSLLLSRPLWKNGNEQREADRKIEENRLFRQELKEYFKENVKPYIDKFLKNEEKYEFSRNGFDENAAVPAGNGNAVYFEKFGNPFTGYQDKYYQYV